MCFHSGASQDIRLIKEKKEGSRNIVSLGIVVESNFKLCNNCYTLPKTSFISGL